MGKACASLIFVLLVFSSKPDADEADLPNIRISDMEEMMNLGSIFITDVGF